MKRISKLTLTLLVLMAAAMALTACGNLSKNIADDGASADQIVWPDMDATNALHSGGTSPTPATIRNIHPGMGKTAIADLIGYPHYGEGLSFSVREWTYLFNLQTPQGDWVQCQYKVLFDTDKKAQSFYWHPKSCAGLINGPTEKTYTLGADALFNFDSATLRPEGQAQLNKLAEKIGKHQDDIAAIKVDGYTDRLGSYAYNMDLSQRRANSVRSYLITQGVKPSLLTAEGHSKDDPVKAGCHHSNRNALIACLQPNRRVAIHVTGKPGTPLE